MGMEESTPLFPPEQKGCSLEECQSRVRLSPRGDRKNSNWEEQGTQQNQADLEEWARHRVGDG